MSYTTLPPGPLPTHCTACGLEMRDREVTMLPMDPHTGKGTRWRVIECPLHEGGKWGTKHHYDWWFSWYHDGFKVAPAPVLAAPNKPEGWPTGLRALAWAIVGLLGVLFVLGMLTELLTT